MALKRASELIQPSIPAPCCENLRCKTMFYRSDERPGLLHPSGTMDYWCSLTSEQIGPDKLVARHATCQEGRECFKAGPRA
jgi:hypothetical protein